MLSFSPKLPIPTYNILNVRKYGVYLTSEQYTSHIASELPSYSTVPEESLLGFCDSWVSIKV